MCRQRAGPKLSKPPNFARLPVSCPPARRCFPAAPSAPHHSISDAGLIGGGSLPRSGDGLSHHSAPRGPTPGAVGFAAKTRLPRLDELPESLRDALEALRQPLEDGIVTLARASATFADPARFTLVAAMNPCPCSH
jgi:magnesium chelatase family protein